VLDNVNALVPNAGVSEAFSGVNVWPQPASTGGLAADGSFVDEILVCADTGVLTPNPQDFPEPPTLREIHW
jgi:hypothetical protein